MIHKERIEVIVMLEFQGPTLDAIIRGARGVLDNAPYDPTIRIEEVKGAVDRGVKAIREIKPELTHSEARDVLTSKV